MSDAKTPPDLSMDEILATIRRIIAEDEQPGALPPTLRAAPPAIDSDVLELTTAIDADGSVRHLVPSSGASIPGAAPASEPPAGPRQPAPASTLDDAPAADTPAADTLVSETASVAAAAAFARLAAAPRGPDEPLMLADRPLDQVVRDLLRPLLQTWLDENLPALVERMVAAEIARLAGKAGAD